MSIDQQPPQKEAAKINPEQEKPETLEERLLTICRELGIPEGLFADYVWIVADQIRQSAAVSLAPSTTISGNIPHDIRPRRAKIEEAMRRADNELGQKSLDQYKGIAVPKVFIPDPENKNQQIVNPVYSLPLGEKEEAHVTELKEALQMLQDFLKIKEDEEIRGQNEISLKTRVANVAKNSLKEIINEALQTNQIQPTTNPQKARLN